MDALDRVLPLYADYLGRFEHDEEEKIRCATDALSELLRSGAQQKVYIENAEVKFSNEQLIVANSNGVREYLDYNIKYNAFCKYYNNILLTEQIGIFPIRFVIFQVAVHRFDIKGIKDPVAFKKRKENANDSPFTRVVIFTEIGGGHFHNDVYHVFQVSSILRDKCL